MYKKFLNIQNTLWIKIILKNQDQVWMLLQQNVSKINYRILFWHSIFTPSYLLPSVWQNRACSYKCILPLTVFLFCLCDTLLSNIKQILYPMLVIYLSSTLQKRSIPNTISEVGLKGRWGNSFLESLYIQSKYLGQLLKEVLHLNHYLQQRQQ